MTNDTNAANNSIPKTDADAKELFDDYTSTQSSPAGFHPDGIDNNNGSIFYPILAYDTDNDALETLAGDNEGIELRTNLNTGPKIPNQNPKMPRPGSRLIDQSTNRNLGNF
jgi:hypothetical protein